MSTYKITVVKPDGEVRNTRFKGMTVENADELAEGIWMGTAPNGNANGLQVVNEDTGEIYSEWEW